MDIIKKDFRNGKVKLKVTDQDDLWYLSHLIDPGDLVRGKTTRKIKIGQSDQAKTVKKTFILQVEAKTVTFSPDGTTLRINGKVKEGPDDVPKDSYHAIALEIGGEFSLEKNNWFTYQKQKLQEAAKKKYNFLVCLFDREESLFALTKKFGYETLAKLKGEVPKKNKTVEVKKDFQQELIKALETYAQRYTPQQIILASPAFYKEDLFKKITNPDLKKKIVLVTCSDISERSLDEVMRRPELKNILKDSRAREEQLLVEELLSEINKNNLAVYGLKEAQKAINAGAVKILLLTDEFIQKQREEDKFVNLDQQMKQVDKAQGQIHILSAKLESGKKLNGLGGIAALLRFKLEW